MNREVFDRTIPDGRCDEPPPSRNRSPGSPPPMAASEGRNPRIRRAADVPPFMTQEYDGRGGWVALAQFAQHWNRHPESREWMKATPLPEDTGPRRGALIAALVHALCLRSGLLSASGGGEDRQTAPRHPRPIRYPRGPVVGGESPPKQLPWLCTASSVAFFSSQPST